MTLHVSPSLAGDCQSISGCAYLQLDAQARDVLLYACDIQLKPVQVLFGDLHGMQQRCMLRVHSTAGLPAPKLADGLCHTPQLLQAVRQPLLPLRVPVGCTDTYRYQQLNCDVPG